MRSRVFGLLCALCLSFFSQTAFAQDPAPTGPTAVTIGSAMSPRQVARMRAQIRRELTARRRVNLARFQRYVARGVYPVNSYQPGYVNVFIDESGHICAAATIISADGHRDVVDRTARERNFVRLGELTEGDELYDWILTSGFTQEEIATIQEPFFMPLGELPPEEQEVLEKERLEARYGEIISQLRRDRRASLEAAVDALLAARLAEAIVLTS